MAPTPEERQAPIWARILANGYRLEGELGGGKRSRAYLARDPSGTQVVIKLPRDADDPRARGQLDCEARCLRAIQHPNVVQVLDILEDARGPIALVLAHIQGPVLGSLAEPLPWATALELLVEIADGLAAIHAAGYLHLDLTAANVVCVGDPRVCPTSVRIIDFGIAEAITASKIGSTHERPGTAGYMAPEVLDGDPGRASDVYSLAVLGFELLAGRRPFESAVEWEVFRAQASEPAPRVEAVNPSVVLPHALSDLLVASLATQPEARPSLAEFRRRLEAIRDTHTTEDAAGLLELRALAERVRDAWILGVFETSVAGLTMIPQRRELVRLTGRRESLASDQAIERIFIQAERRLKIVGEPGFGKTVAMLKLARALLRACVQDPLQPVPVVLSLSGWSENDRILSEFALRELGTKYGVSPRRAQQWLDTGRLLLMVDAVDEAPLECREHALEAIRCHLAAAPPQPFVVTCRSEIADVIAMDALQLHELRHEDTARFLGGDWLSLSNAFLRDPRLEQLARTPWLLQLMRKSLHEEGFLDASAVDHSHAWLIDRYVDTIMKGSRADRVGREQLDHDLRALARLLARQNRGMFVLEELQPGLLPRPHRMLYLLATRTIVVSAIVAAAVPTVVYSPLDNGGFVPTPSFVRDLAAVMLVVLTSGFVLWAHLGPRIRSAWQAIVPWGVALGALGAALLWCLGHRHPTVWVFGVNAGLIVGIVHGGGRRNRGFPEHDIDVVESISWDLRRISRTAWSRLLLVISVSFAFFALFESVVTALTVGGLVMALGLLILAASPERLERRMTPNVGILRSLRSSLLGGGLGFALAFTVLAIAYGGIYAVIGGTFVGMLVGLSFGGIDVCHHYVLRLILAWRRSVPLHIARRLDKAVHVGLLRRAGNGYLFSHPDVREHFWKKEEP